MKTILVLIISLVLMSQNSWASLLFQNATNYSTGNWKTCQSVAIADLDGNSKLDMVVSGSNGISVFLANGDDTFQTPTYYQDPNGNGAVSVAIGDLDGDGVLDLAAGNQWSNKVMVLQGVGDGTFQATPTATDNAFSATASYYVVGSTPSSIAIGDLDGDGNQDLAVAKSLDQNISVLLSDGNSGFHPAVNFVTAYSHPAYAYRPHSVVIGDLNNDNRLDLVARGGGVSVLLGNGNGTFQSAQPYRIPGNHMFLHYGNNVAIGYLDSDGVPDLAVANFWEYAASVLQGVGDGTFLPATNIGDPIEYPASVAVAIGDLDGDSVSDLAVINESDDSVSVFLGNGNGTFQPAVNFAVGDEPSSIAIADLDGNSMPDLVVANASSKNVSVLINLTPVDRDSDGYVDDEDNCPTVYNPLQEQTGNNVGGQFGDACVDPTVVIPDNADIAPDVVIGAGSQINNGVTVEPGAELGNDVTLNKDSTVGEDTVVGDNTSVNQGVAIGSDVVIGENVTIGRNVIIGNGVTIGDNTVINQGTVIEDNATIGMNVTIGKNVTVLATANVPDGTIVPKDTVVTP